MDFILDSWHGPYCEFSSYSLFWNGDSWNFVYQYSGDLSDGYDICLFTFADVLCPFDIGYNQWLTTMVHTSIHMLRVTTELYVTLVSLRLTKLLI